MKVVAVTACPSGVAHTYMAAESLKVADDESETCSSCFVETQGQIGIEDELTAQQIQAADVVILTNDIGIKNETRFKGKPVLRVKAGDLIKKSPVILSKLASKLGA